MKPTTALALFGTLLVSAACTKQEAPAVEQARPVRSMVAGHGADGVGASYSGELRARYESRLGFQTGGKIVARSVEVGSRVRRGQPLLRLDPAQESLHLAAATADVDAARSRVAQNRIDVERTEQLLARQFASQAELDQQRLALAQSESQLRTALAQQQIKSNQRGFTELLADRDGVVTAIQAEAGQVVSAGQAIVTLAGDGEREVVVNIPESRVDELRRATRLQVSFWARPGVQHEGRLRELAPDADSVTRTYAARIAVTDADTALTLGMTATVFAAGAESERRIRLPLTAILDKGDRSLVWVVDESSSRVAAQPVTLAGVQGESVIVASGLRGGETVVTAGVHMLHEGQAVKTVEAATVAAGARP
jgi:membrane fusion protein, multidrug efflux system